MTSPYLVKHARQLRLTHDGLRRLYDEWYARHGYRDPKADHDVRNFLDAARDRLIDDSGLYVAKSALPPDLPDMPPGKIEPLDWPPEVMDAEDRKIEAVIVAVLLLAVLGLWKLGELASWGFSLAWARWGF